MSPDDRGFFVGLFKHDDPLTRIDKPDRDGFLEGTCGHGVGWKELVVRSCRVHEEELKAKLAKLVGTVVWNDVRIV
jgi:hypothetical protein